MDGLNDGPAVGCEQTDCKFVLKPVYLTVYRFLVELLLVVHACSNKRVGLFCM